MDSPLEMENSEKEAGVSAAAAANVGAESASDEKSAVEERKETWKERERKIQKTKLYG